MAEAIIEKSKSRFEVDLEPKTLSSLLALAPGALEDRQALRIRREGVKSGGWRTLLIASIRSLEDLPKVIRWSAEVRDYLEEPETADLYLLLIVADVPEEECIQIEADEQFCRKFVQRPGESIVGMLDRTFLNQLTKGTVETGSAEPLAQALSNLGTRHTWLTPDQQEVWRTALLSGVTGAELAEALLQAVPAQPEDKL